MREVGTALNYSSRKFLWKIIKFHINIWNFLVKSWETLLNIGPWRMGTWEYEREANLRTVKISFSVRRDWFQTVEDVVTMNMNHDAACKLREHHLFWDVSNWVSSVITRDQWYDHCSSLNPCLTHFLSVCNSGAEQWKESYL